MDVGSDFIRPRRFLGGKLCWNIQELGPLPVSLIVCCLNKTLLKSSWILELDSIFWYWRRNKALISELSTPPPGTEDLYFPTKYSQNFMVQCIACFWKQYKSYWRNPSYTAVRMFFTTITALMFGTIFWRLGSKTYVYPLFVQKHV